MSTVLTVPEVAEVVDRAAAPRQARLPLTRLLDAHPELTDRLSANRLFDTALVSLPDASRSKTEAVIADPTLLAPLDDRDALAVECSHDAYTEKACQAVAAEEVEPGRGLRR